MATQLKVSTMVLENDGVTAAGASEELGRRQTLTGAAIEKYRRKLLDTSGRNPLISFKHSDRSKKQIRVIDEVPDVLFKRLSAGSSFSFIPLKKPDGLEPSDERTKEFRAALKEAKRTEITYLQRRESLGKSPSKRDLHEIEVELRDRLRTSMGLPPVERSEAPDLDEIARLMGLDPSFELPQTVGKGEGSQKYSDSNLQTLTFEEDLDARLGAIYQQSQLEEAERGVSTLHLAFGFLEWYESDDSDERIFSPLLLHPIDIERVRDGAKIKFPIKSREEELLVNLSLKERLLRDFHFVLPELEVNEPEDSEGESPESYFSRLEQSLEPLPRWKIHRCVTLSFFSFVRLALYQDLDPTNWPPGFLSQNRGLIELFTSQDRVAGSSGGSYDERETSPKSQPAPLHIADADSSQLNALIQALSGVNMVIDGPPGTGKSQTITNLIAAALAEGKRVLFVCEKLAALKVVQNRLGKADLGRFCLELHSTKARKTEVLKSLQERLAFGQKRSPWGYEKDLSELENLKTSLNDYCRTMNTPLDDGGPTLFEVLGRSVSLNTRLEDLKDFLSSASVDATAFSRLDLPHIGHLLAECERSQNRAIEQLGSLKTLSLRELVDSSTGLFEQESVVQSVKKGLEIARRCSEGLASVRLVGIPPQISTADLQRSLNQLLALGEIPPAILALLEFLKRHENGEEQLRHFISEIEASELLHKKVIEIFSKAESLDLQVADSMASVGGSIERIGLKSDGPVLEEVNALEKRLAEQQSILVRLDFVIPKLAIPCGLTAQEIRTLALASDLASAVAPNVFRLLSRRYLLDDSEVVMREAELRAGELLASGDDLGRYANVDPRTDLNLLTQNAAVVRSAGLFARLRQPFKVAKDQLLRSLRPSIPFSPQKLADLAERVASYLSKKSEFEQNGIYREFFDTQYEGIHPPFQEARMLTEWIRKVRESLSIVDPFQNSIRDLLLTGNRDQHELLREAKKQRIFHHAADVLDKYPGANFRNATAKTVEDLVVLQKNLPVLISAGLKPRVTAEELATYAEDVQRYIRNCEVIKRTEFEPLLRDFSSVRERMIAITSGLNFVASIRELEPSIQDVLLQPEGLSTFAGLREKIASIRGHTGALEELIEHAFRADLIVGVPLINRSVLKLCEFFEDANEKVEGIPVYLAFLVATENAKSAGLTSILNVFDGAEIRYRNLGEGFEFIWCRAVMKSALEKNPSLSKFFGLQHEQARTRFADLDRQCLDHHQKHLVAQLTCKPVPEGVSYGKASEITERSLIEREIKKKKRHIPLRKLIRRSGTAIQALKPCFMMSPLSVAQFLAPGAVNFELIVMDEASQIRPEDALGAIARGAQVVVVGDPKQLPPTNFFNRLELEVDEGNEDDVEAAAFDSVLDLAQSWQKEGLRWHYRSRHHSLIAFSNRHFYDDDLIVFPGPQDGAKDCGILFIKEDGRYIAHRNVEEARRIISEVLLLSSQHPERSVGVVSVNQEQRDLLADLFDDEIRRNATFSSYVDSWENTLEPFFVKNLENVQGDERDVIFISCVYGKDADGNFYRRFGPINSTMGHRRLNVLFTRSKYQMIVIASFEPEDLVLDASSGSGIKALKGFLEFAKSGKLPPTMRMSAKAPEPTEFENSVRRSLETMGHEVVPQVGVAGYFLDLAVRDPNSGGRFLLGIECDGSTYHSARSARDRDRLRQEILENLGWKIHRIWSLDWFRNPRKEIERLRDVIQHLKDPSRRTEPASSNGQKSPELVTAATPDQNRNADPDISLKAVENEDINDEIKYSPNIELAAEPSPAVAVFRREVTTEERKCPACAANREVFLGRFGPYTKCLSGCAGKNSPLQQEIVRRVIDKLDLTCDKCQAPVQLAKGPMGLFIGCSRYPNCKSILYWSALLGRFPVE